MPKSNKPCRPPPVLAAIVCALVLGGCATQEIKVDEVYGGYYPSDSANSVAPKRVAKAKSKPKSADRALLETPPEPDCGVQNSPGRPQTASAAREVTTQSIPDSTGDPNADLAMRIKLEYERECYRQAEARTRDRLKQLQTSKAAKGGAQPSDRTAQ
ncbi:MAG: hypothetical protein ABW200_16860 [Hyphomicrobiaceae bacterium]